MVVALTALWFARLPVAYVARIWLDLGLVEVRLGSGPGSVVRSVASCLRCSSGQWQTTKL